MPTLLNSPDLRFQQVQQKVDSLTSRRAELQDHLEAHRVFMVEAQQAHVSRLRSKRPVLSGAVAELAEAEGELDKLKDLLPDVEPRYKLHSFAYRGLSGASQPSPNSSPVFTPEMRQQLYDAEAEILRNLRTLDSTVTEAETEREFELAALMSSSEATHGGSEAAVPVINAEIKTGLRRWASHLAERVRTGIGTILVGELAQLPFLDPDGYRVTDLESSDEQAYRLDAVLDPATNQWAESAPFTLEQAQEDLQAHLLAAALSYTQDASGINGSVGMFSEATKEFTKPRGRGGRR